MDFLGYVELPNYVIVTICLLCLYIYARWPYTYLKDFGIPGPEPWTFIGNLHSLAMKGMMQFDKEMITKYGKVCGYYLGYTPTILISDPEIIKQISVKEFSNFTNRFEFLPPNDISDNFLSTIKNDHWKFVRSVLAPTFNSKRMKQMVPLISKVVETMDENCCNIADTGKEVDVTQLYAWYTMDVITSTAFGIEVNSQKNPDHPLIKSAVKFFQVNFRDAFTSLLVIYRPIWKLIKFFNISTNYHSTLENMSMFSKDVIEDRKKNNKTRDDFLQLMLDAQLGKDPVDADTKEQIEGLKFDSMKEWRDNRGLTESEVISQSVMFFLAGYETTSTTLSFLSHTLAIHPHIQDKLYDEIKSVIGEEEPNYENLQRLTYLDMCIAESLRMYPVLYRIPREAKNNIKINGWVFPKHTDISFSVYTLHHDPEYWPEPYKFIPERFTPEAKAERHPFAYLPFGAGPRICIGMRFAQLELKLAMARVICKYRFVRSPKTKDRIEFGKHLLLSAKDGIWMKIERR